MEEVYSRTRELWSIDEEGDTIDARRIFDRRERVVLEIGAGRGDLAIDAALRNDDLGLIAIDVHTRGIANMLSAIELHGLSNLRVVEGDAQVFVRRLPDECLDEIWVFFPDPWPKARHRNRRLLRADMIATLTRPLRAGGVLRLATDIDDYARTATRAIEQSREATTTSVAEMLETNNMLRSDTTTLFERLREANILLQEVLTGAHENMSAIENTLDRKSTRLNSSHRT